MQAALPDCQGQVTSESSSSGISTSSTNTLFNSSSLTLKHLCTNEIKNTLSLHSKHETVIQSGLNP